MLNPQAAAQPGLPARIPGLAALAPAFSAILCDVWGVLHNGIVPFLDAAEALRRFRAGGGTVVLLTNAPRPGPSIVAQLDQIGVPRVAYDRVVTSGDVTREVLVAAAQPVFHLGPSRDDPLYADLPVLLTAEEDAGIICCTGLIDDESETAADYEGQLRRLAARGLPMVCANPDLVVERGGRLVPCAGALAVRYEQLGGAVTMVGKPYPAVYEASLARFTQILGYEPLPERILAIGDGAATDIRGANRAGIDALFVTAGIHAAAFTADSGSTAIAAFLATQGGHARAAIDRLRW